MKRRWKRVCSLMLAAMLLTTTLDSALEVQAANKEVILEDGHQKEETAGVVEDEEEISEEFVTEAEEEILEEVTEENEEETTEAKSTESIKDSLISNINESNNEVIADEEQQSEVVLSEESQEEVSLDDVAKAGYKRLQRIELGEIEEEIPTTTLLANRYASSTWDTYSSKYFYNQMSYAQKQLYDSAYNALMNYLTTSSNAESYNSLSGFTAPIYVPAGMSQTAAEQVLFVLSTNNPQFYFVNEYYGFGSAANGNYIKIGIYPDWVSGTTRSSATSQISTKINSWMSQINAETTTTAKEKKAHDLIVENTTYSYASYNQSCAGVLVEGKAVCAGYSEAFALLCNGAGINTICVTSLEHEWNIVQLYGNWYVVDCTWDDMDDGNIYYNYFNKSNATISEGYHEIESVWNGLTIPTCSYDTVIPLTTYNGINYAAVYDEDYYVSKYPDIRNAFGTDSEAILTHFVEYGMSEGRQGSAEFDIKSYKNQNADLRAAYGNDLKSYYLHYVLYGKAEGRKGTGCTSLQGSITVYQGVDYSAVYDYNYYISHYADMKKAYSEDDIGALEHFVIFGMSEGRQAKESFDVKSYRNQYQDLRGCFGKDLKSYYLHYIQHGKSEGRKTTGVTTLQNPLTVYQGVDYSAVYDYNYYISHYADMKKTYSEDDIGALEHFVIFGMSEGRQAKESFDVKSYRNQYQDLRGCFGKELKSYYLHYIQHGKSEGRKTTGVTMLQNPLTVYQGVDYSAVYDYNYYISHYADMKKTYSEDDIGALEHFVIFGMSEGRQGSAEFNVSCYRSNYADLDGCFGNNLKAYYVHYINYGKNEGVYANKGW